MKYAGDNFLRGRTFNNVPETSELTSFRSTNSHKVFSDAKALGIKREEVDEEVDSLYRTSSSGSCTSIPVCPS
ncbi:hypothetical protein ACVWWD_005613 [Mesorhizobium sp. URHB0026]